MTASMENNVIIESLVCSFQIDQHALESKTLHTG